MTERVMRLPIRGCAGPVSPAVSLAAAKIAVDKEYSRQTLPYKMPQISIQASHRQSQSLALGPSIELHPDVARKQLLPSHEQNKSVTPNVGHGPELWSPEEKLLAMESVPRKRSSRTW